MYTKSSRTKGSCFQNKRLTCEQVSRPPCTLFYQSSMCFHDLLDGTVCSQVTQVWTDGQTEASLQKHLNVSQTRSEICTNSLGSEGCYSAESVSRVLKDCMCMDI